MKTGDENTVSSIFWKICGIGAPFKTVARIYAGNDLRRIDNGVLPGLIAEMSDWATNRQAAERLVDTVGRSYLPIPDLPKRSKECVYIYIHIVIIIAFLLFSISSFHM